MPNWVYNKVILSSEDLTVLDFLEKKLESDEELLSFNKIIPAPTDKLYDVNWATDNWGTKWDASNLHRTRVSEQILEYSFDTPWSPPLPVFEELAKQHSNISIVLEFEEEQGFGAIFSIDRNSIKVVKEWDIPSSHEELYNRGRSCYCESWDEPAFSDCFHFRAKLLYPNDKVFLEQLKVLAENWTESFDELVQVARKL